MNHFIERQASAARSPSHFVDRRVIVRISSKDLEDIQTLAIEDGIPYQTLMFSILHRYVTGRLVDRKRQLPAEAVDSQSRAVQLLTSNCFAGYPLEGYPSARAVSSVRI